MIFRGGHICKTWILMTGLATWIMVTGESTENKLNVKVGFDLTQGDDGVPFLRIRDFEGSYERKQEAQEDQTQEPKEKKPGVRADSDNGSDKDSSSESKETRGRVQHVDDEDSGSRLKSTKGLKPSEFEPEEAADGGVRYDNSETDENIGSGSR